jgi:hypothetical protein
MQPVSVTVANKSSAVSDADVQKLVAALQIQVSTHLADAWNVDASITFVAPEQPPGSSYRMLILDDSDDPRGTGYHYSDNTGTFAKVFARTANKLGQSWSWTVVASHELLEMLINPFGNRAAFVVSNDMDITGLAKATGITGVYYDLEICDPVYPDDCRYTIGDINVSNFVFPAWFAPWITTATRFDQSNKLTAAMQLAPGALIAASNTGRYNAHGPQSVEAPATTARLPNSFVTSRFGIRR